MRVHEDPRQLLLYNRTVHSTENWSNLQMLQYNWD